MLNNLMSRINKTGSYPHAEVLVDSEYLPATMDYWLHANLNPVIIGVTRIYGLKKAQGGVERALAFLHKIRTIHQVSHYVKLWICCVNPRQGRDEETSLCLTEAIRMMRELYEGCLPPIKIMHVTQVEGSPQSWTGGVSAPAALLHQIVPRKDWGRVYVWNFTTESSIASDQVIQAEMQLHGGDPVCTVRYSPKWLHPLLEWPLPGKLSEFLPMNAVVAEAERIAFLQKLDSEEADAWLAHTVSIQRGTCAYVPLSQTGRYGLYDPDCNAFGGMEDAALWLRTLGYWLPSGEKSIEMEPVQMTTADGVCAWCDKPQSAIWYGDDRIDSATTEEQKEAQGRKFQSEIEALRGVLRRHFSGPSPHVLDMEFSLPS